MTEEWRPIPGIKYYEASSLGRIRRTSNTPRCIKTRLLRGKIATYGKRQYRLLTLSVDGKLIYTTAHRLVCLAFHGKPIPPRDHVAHGDGNGLHNKPRNLRWATPQENEADKEIHGTRFRRADHPRAILSEKDVEKIRARGVAGGMRAMGREFGVSHRQIKRVLDGVSWR